MGFPEIHLDYQYTMKKLEQLYELEIENLQKVVEILDTKLKIAELENSRYKEALEKIENHCAWNDEAWRVASEALKGE